MIYSLLSSRDIGVKSHLVSGITWDLSQEKLSQKSPTARWYCVLHKQAMLSAERHPKCSCTTQIICWFSPEPQLSLGQWVLPAYMVVSAPGKIITQCLLTDLIPGHRFFASSPVPRISYTYDWLLQLMIKPQKQNLCFMNFSFSSIFTSFE